MQSGLQETRKFPPPASISKSAHVKSMAEYDRLYKESIENPDKFWGERAGELHWFKKWDRVLEWNLPDAKWFVGGKTNLSYNCIDRQVQAGLGDKVAIVWEGEPYDAAKPVASELVRLTYNDLLREVSKFANVLKSLGVKKGEVVTLYMPMIPELAIAMLACARIGAPHSIIFGGFSASAIKDRVEDAKSKIIVTADGGYRRGKVVPLKAAVDEALTSTDVVKTVVVYDRVKGVGGFKFAMKAGRDHLWSDLMAKASDKCPAEPMDSEDLLFILYTSGSTGKPKGIMHTTGGYMVYTYLTSRYVFDLHGEDPAEMHWCTADIGWVTGHSYIVYGVLPNRVATLMFEGAPNQPANDRFWDIIQRHKVTKFYTAPTAIRAFMKWGEQEPKKHDLSSLKILGSVGEPINPEAWMWYHEHIGGKRCPIVDTWWQTETGGHMITPLPGATTTVPGSCTRPFFGIDVSIVNKDGQELPANAGGFLVIKKPWPSILRGILGDRERFLKTYWSEIKGCYFAGDGARRDLDGNFWVMGRVDDVINVSGHRLGTMEVESALVSHPSVAEAAVVGMPHEIKGTGIAAFVTLKTGKAPTEELKKELTNHVGHEIGAIAKPDQIRFTEALPKTRSGKIMRRLLRELASGQEVKGDTTTLEDFSILAKLRDTDEA
ncbi:MAG: acetate--CoA ligase [Planctomycetes bacterium]|nr:acetate--CoA ligase [Planctomycetota bacterium]